MPIVKITQSVSHNRHNLHEGEVREDLTQADVNVLKEMGFAVDYVEETAVEPPADAQSDEDLIGAKMDVEVQNKMAPAPSNKKAR